MIKNFWNVFCLVDIIYKHKYMALFTKITVFAKYSLKLCGFWSIVSLLEIYRVKLARAMYSSAFSNSAFLTLSGGGLIHGTDFTSDFIYRLIRFFYGGDSLWLACDCILRHIRFFDAQFLLCRSLVRPALDCTPFYVRFLYAPRMLFLLSVVLFFFSLCFFTT